MPIGTQWNQAALNTVLTGIAQGWADVAAGSQQLWTLIEGGGGLALLEGNQVGYSAGDAAEVLALIGQFNQLAQIITGQADLPAAFDFLSSFAAVMTPDAILIR